MTAIVGLVQDGKMWMGGDAMFSDGAGASSDTIPKVRQLGDTLLGASGTARVVRVALHLFKPPIKPKRMDDMDYIVGPWTESLRGTLDAHGCLCRENNEDAAMFSAVVGFRGRMYGLDAAFGVTCSVDGYEAAGIGEHVTKGVLYATPRLAPERRIRLALAAAERHCSGVRGPFTVLRMPA